MPEAKHTPGPWITHRDGQTIYRKREGTKVATASIEAPRHRNGTGFLARTEARANAHLICASPDLLEACEELLELLDQHGLTNYHEVDQARKAVAKARGQEGATNGN